LFRRCAEVLPVHGAHDIRVPIDEPQEFVQQPKEASHAHEYSPRERVVVLLQLGLHPFEYYAYKIANGDEQRPESQGSYVVSKVTEK